MFDATIPEPGWNREPRRLRIAVYMQDLAGGGSERVNLTLAREWQAKGHDVTLLLHSMAGELIPILPAGVRVVSFETRRVLADVPRLARFLRHEKPDVLVASLEHNNIAALLAKALSFSRTRVLICQHNPFSTAAAGVPRGLSYRAMPYLYWMCAPLACKLIAVSRGVADDTRAVTRMPGKKIVSIYNPVLTPEFDQLAEGACTHPWLQPGQPPVFVGAGRLHPQKHHAFLVRAIAAHARRGGNGRLMVLGEGAEREELQGLANQLGVADRVSFPGFVKNPLPYIRRAKAFVLGSRYEGLGNVLVEAMGVGTPVISTDCTYGPSEILEDGRHGVLVPVDDPEAMAVAMANDLRARWPAEALMLRAASFRSSVIADQYLALMVGAGGFAKGTVDQRGRWA